MEVIGSLVSITAGLGNAFYSGAIEGCITKGLTITTTESLANKFFGTDFEQNGPGNAGPDIECDSLDNEFIGIDTFTEIIFTANAINNRIIGGSHKEIQIDSGATATLITNTIIDRFGDIPAGIIDDNGTDTLIRDISDNQGVVVTEQGRTLNPTSLPVKVLLTVGASPFTYQNTSNVTQAIGVETNEPITSISYGRIGAGELVSSTHGLFELAPGDEIGVIYPGAAPQMHRWDRAR